MPRPKIRQLAILGIPVALVLVFMLLNVQRFFVSTEESLHQWNQTKNILYWHSRWDERDMYLGLGGKIFQHCKYRNCFTTYHRTALPVEQFDAIIFHGAEYDFSLFDYPRKRSPEQVYVYLNHEYPQRDKIFYDNFYNWTWSYRTDSDIYQPYGVTVKNQTNFTLPGLKQFKTKKKLVAWMVSNCDTPGKREVYVEKLKQYLQVDVYGECGDLKCTKGDYDYCYKMIARNYYFYLSFENSNCRDYVTEKFFNVLSYNVIPVVYGGADYANIAPEHSYIDVKNFRTVRALADYLIRLSENPEEYLGFFEWKRKYSVYSTTRATNERVLCDLCQKLNENHERKQYDKLEEWWRGNSSKICSTTFIDTLAS